MNNHSFCRSELKNIMREVIRMYTKEQIKKVWVWSDGRDNWEFHGPNGEYFSGLRCSDCAWSAKAIGWSRLMNKEEVE